MTLSKIGLRVGTTDDTSCSNSCRYSSSSRSRDVSRKSRSGPAKKDPYDHLANKTLILVATDGIITMSYTGDAFVARTPTDQWLAEAITGKEWGVPSMPFVQSPRRV